MRCSSIERPHAVYLHDDGSVQPGEIDSEARLLSEPAGAAEDRKRG